MSWAPAECTLSVVERPRRAAEFAALFASALRGLARPEPWRAVFTLDGTDRVETQVRDLVAKEQACCPVFDFAIKRTKDGALRLEVRVDDRRTAALDALAAGAAEVAGDMTA
jgi:hypothetical protein